MTIEQLRERLKDIVVGPQGKEEAHIDADELLLKFINDAEVTEIFHDGNFWYA